MTSSTGYPFLVRGPDGSNYTYHRVLPAEIVPWLDGEHSLSFANEPLSLNKRNVVKVSLKTADQKLAIARWQETRHRVEEVIADAKVRSGDLEHLRPVKDLTTAEVRDLRQLVRHDMNSPEFSRRRRFAFWAVVRSRRATASCS